MKGPDPSTIYPLENINRLCFLKNIVRNSKIQVGDFTYYDDFEDVYNFERNVKYLFDFSIDKLIIGKYCMIASGVEFIMNGANHLVSSLSTYPFYIFGHGWEDSMEGKAFPFRGDTIIGNDVWLGYKSSILPGIHIGDGAIIGAFSVVTKNVEPYSIVGGNPANEIRKRFSKSDIKKLLKISWWDGDISQITDHVKVLTGNSIGKLEETFYAKINTN